MDLEVLARILRDGKKGLVEAEELLGRHAGAGVVEVRHHMLPGEAPGENPSERGDQDRRVVRRRPADSGVRQGDSHVLLVYLAVSRSAVQITYARLLVEGELGAGPVDVEGQRVGRPVSKHAYEVERG